MRRLPPLKKSKTRLKRTRKRRVLSFATTSLLFWISGRSLWVGSLFLFASCSYQFDSVGEGATFSVPFTTGEMDGQLTQEIVKKISETGRMKYQRGSGRYEIVMRMVTDQKKNIGYQYDRKEFSGKREKNLQPAENRRVLTVEASIFDTYEQKVVVGPKEITVSTDFDFVDIDSLQDLSVVTPQGKRESVIFFSEGQLDSVEGGEDAALLVLYRKVAAEVANLCYGLES